MPISNPDIPEDAESLKDCHGEKIYALQFPKQGHADCAQSVFCICRSLFVSGGVYALMVKGIITGAYAFVTGLIPIYDYIA